MPEITPEKSMPRFALHQIEHQWITMSDGVRLAARLWLPQGAGPVPGVLEYIPYRKRDMVRARDERNHPYFASHGYACLRVDMRGSGDSEGVMPDMYAPEELSDARHVIEWIAAQPWCDGTVGMFGTSWGGTASLQAAVDAPGPLKAIIANCATIDRFEDDIHWMGGCLLTDSIEWGAALPAILAAPPDAETVGGNWMEMWKARLERLTFPFENWIRHSTRGEFWRQGSVRFTADQLTCPVLAIGGWADRYSNSVMRLVSARPDLCWGIVGPWGHHYPDVGEPGPAIGFQEIALHWWDRWLKPGAPGDLTWPKLRVWQREFDPPQDRVSTRSGRWLEANDLHPGTALEVSDVDGTLVTGGQNDGSYTVPDDAAHGACAGDTGYFGRVGGLPLEQSPDDARALCFETDTLAEDTDLFGHAEVLLGVMGDTLPAHLVCRICDVAPDGRSNLVTRTVLNLGLDDDLDAEAPGQSGVYVQRRVRFPTMVYRFAKGHRLRLAFGSSYWPLIWPCGHHPGLRLDAGTIRLSLPGLPASAGPLADPFPLAKTLPESPTWNVRSEGPLERAPQTLTETHVKTSWTQPKTHVSYDEIGVDIATQTSADYELSLAGDTASCVFRHVIAIERADGRAEVQSKLRLDSEGSDFSAAATFEVDWKSSASADHSFHTVISHEFALNSDEPVDPSIK